MKRSISPVLAVKRVHLAFHWAMRDEERRWPIFRRIADRYQPLVNRVPKAVRVEILLCAMSGGDPARLSDEARQLSDEARQLSE